MKPRVTCVLPYYNKVRYVRRALDSIASQTLGDFEAIVVDDGSTDGGTDLITDFARLDPRFRIVRQPNAGPGAARNRAIRQARTSLVAFLDADDEWMPTYLERSL